MMEFVSWDDDIPNIWRNNPNNPNVPNHQPVYHHPQPTATLSCLATNIDGFTQYWLIITDGSIQGHPCSD
jgi:hypothetical protein